jgi:hypothetical protein
VARKKPEGIEALAAKPEPPSIQDITMLDWFAAFALMGIGTQADSVAAASMAFDRAEEMMKQREKR